ncbi:MAG: RNA polymerase sigma factor [Phycisphaerae bacterium]|nr:RNA polymerase sigma factor [Phycisphaerae bacterium]
MTSVNMTTYEPADGRGAPATSGSSLMESAVESVSALTAAVVGGDRNAYVRLFELRCEFVEREANRRLVRRRDLAPDAAQDVWLRVARAPAHCESASKLDAWLQRIVTNVVIDMLRAELARRMREERVAGSRPEAQQFVSDVELLDGMREELRRLDALAPHDRSILELRARTGSTLTQLATLMGIGRAAADSRLRRACELVRQAIDGELS